MESAAAWSRYWQVLDQIDDPDNKPNLQLFDEILARTDVRGTAKAAGPAHAKGRQAASSNAVRRSTPSQRSYRLGSAAASVPLVGALHFRQRPGAPRSTARPPQQRWRAEEAAAQGLVDQQAGASGGQSPWSNQQQQGGLQPPGQAPGDAAGGGRASPQALVGSHGLLQEQDHDHDHEARGHVPKLNLCQLSTPHPADTAPALDQPLSSSKSVPNINFVQQRQRRQEEEDAGAGGGTPRSERGAAHGVDPAAAAVAATALRRRAAAAAAAAVARPQSAATPRSGAATARAGAESPTRGGSDGVQFQLGQRPLSRRAPEGKPRALRTSSSQDERTTKPDSRYKEILERTAKRKPGPAASPRRGVQPVLGAWGLAQGPELLHQHNRLSGVSEELEPPKSLGAQGILDACDAEMQGIRQALQLLHTFSLGSVVRPKLQGHLQEAEEILQELAGEELPQQQRGGSKARTNPLAELLRPLPRPPLEFPASAAWDYLLAAQSRLGGVDALEGIVKEMRRKVQVLLEKGGMGSQGPEAVRVSAQSPPRQEAPTGQPRAAQQFKTSASFGSLAGMSYSRSSAAGSSPATPSSPYRLQPGTAEPWTDRGGGTERIPEEDDSSPWAGEAGEQRGGGGGRGPRGRGAPNPQSRLSMAGAGAGATTAGAQGSDASDELWQWLENLVAQAQGSDATRLQLSRPEAPSALPSEMHAFNPYTSLGPRHEVAVDRLVSMVHSFQEHYKVSEAEALRRVRVQQAQPALERNALQAAARSAVDPAHLQRVLYLVIRLATSMGAGSLRPQDAGVLLLGSSELLLGEVQWLLSLIQLTQGPCSPHLQALHAVLKAYEAQTVYSGKLRSRAEELQACLEDAVDRAEACERHVDTLAIANREQAEAAEKLQRRNEELELELRQLKARMARSADGRS